MIGRENVTSHSATPTDAGPEHRHNTQMSFSVGRVRPSAGSDVAAAVATAAANDDDDVDATVAVIYSGKELILRQRGRSLQ